MSTLPHLPASPLCAVRVDPLDLVDGGHRGGDRACAPRRRSRRAFSLVEVLIGTCVLLFLLIPALLVVQQATRLTSCARMQTRGSALLQTLVEDFRAMPFTDIRSSFVTARSQPVDLTALLPSEGFGTPRTYYAAVEFSEPAGQADFLHATFTLTWADAFGHTQSRQYHTRFTKDGLSDQILRGF